MTARPIYRILGRLEVRVAPERWVAPRGHLATALAILLVNADRLVESARMKRALWSNPPPSSGGQLHKHMSALHKLLDQAGRAGSLVNDPGMGYRLTVAEDELDALVFRRRVAEAERHAAGGRAETAYTVLGAALELWRDRVPLVGIDSPAVRGASAELGNRRLRAAERFFALALRLGDYERILDEMPLFLEPDPARERLWTQWILALYRTGRPAQAFAEYESFEALTAGGPNPLWELGNALLHDDARAIDAHERGLSGRAPALDAGRSAPTVAQPLPPPAGIPDLTGRAERIEAVLHLLAERRTTHSPVVLTGPTGVGKTVLAVHIAHRARRLFPDGVLYVELRGSGPQPASLDEVLARLLRALGSDPLTLPPDWAARISHYHRRLGDRRLLLVLDDAAGDSRLADLLPLTPSSAALVTSQDRLDTLPGARHVRLAELDLDTAVSLYRRVARDGGAVLEGEDEGARGVAEACGRLPLALRVAGAQRATYRNVPSDVLASWLLQGNLDMFVHGGLDVPAAIAASYERLDGPARTLLRRLALLDLPDFAPWVAAAVFDTPPAAAAELLARLAGRSLLEETGPDPLGQARYRFHDLIRRYARQLAEQHEDRRAVPERGYGALLSLAEHAHRRLCGGDYEIVHGAAPRWHLPPRVRDRLLADPMAFYDAERLNIRAAVRHTAHLGMAELCWDLAISTHEFYGIRGWLDYWTETHTLALAACRAANDLRGEAAMLAILGQPTLAHSQRENIPGVVELTRAVELFASMGDTRGEAIALRALASAHRREGAFAQARHRLAQARQRYEESGDRLGAWQAVRLLGQTYLDLGEPRRALSHLAEATTLAGGTGHGRAEPQTAYWLARAHLDLGDVAAATSRFDTVVSTATASGDRAGIAYGLHGLGDAAGRARRWEEAKATLERALDAAKEAKDLVLEGRILCSLAEVRRHHGDHHEAVQHLAEAQRRFAARGATWLRANALRALGAARRDTGDAAGARQAWREALSLFTEMGLPAAETERELEGTA